MKVDDLFSLKDKTVLVSGASSGIGLHAARCFSAAGAAVALASRRLDRMEPVINELVAAGRPAVAVYLDVTKPGTIGPAFNTAEQQLGAPIDVLINNAGVLYAELFTRQLEADIDLVFDTNLKGAFMVAQEAARRMMLIKRGAIVNVASTAGLRAGSFMASYGASKAALIHLTRVMALELAGKNIRVNVLCPGNIETDMQTALTEKGFHDAMLGRTPLRRFGKPDDLDGALLLLASEAGRYMTGSVVTVDGGQTLSWM
jgi:NAD(P)-dependent dehydrogenase (short-subunit alcohol dehydrogenase family)